MTTVEAHKSRRRGADPLIPSAMDGMRDLVNDLNPTRIKRTVSGEVSFRVLPISADEDKVALRELVDRWMKSGPNLRKMFSKDPELAGAVRFGETVLYPGIQGRGYLDWSPRTPESHLSTQKYDFSSPKDRALKRFVRLITNPEWALLAGPCRRCDHYFLNDSKRRKVYCSRTCSSTATAVSTIKKKRAKGKADKLERARKLIRDWKRANTKHLTWEQWVLRDPQFTGSWITRAVNSGFLEGPSA